MSALETPTRPFPPRAVIEALDGLRRALSYAADTGVDPWQFAVELDELVRHGLVVNDLRWLILKGLVLHARETTIPGATARTFTPLPATAIPPDARFVLTTTGSGLCDTLGQLVSNPDAHPDRTPIAPSPIPPTPDHTPTAPAPHPLSPSPGPPSTLPTADDKPTWDPNRRELRFRGQVVKRYRVPAPNQELILAAFEEDGWPDSIDDPLPPVPDIEPRRRLQATVKSLNRCQAVEMLRFHGNGGERVLWGQVVDT